MTPTAIANLIESTSARLCREHYEMSPEDTWYHGGSGHNDDRLTARVIVRGDGLTVEVSDGNATEVYSGPGEDAAIRAYVHDWLSDLWVNANA